MHLLAFEYIFINNATMSRSSNDKAQTHLLAEHQGAAASQGALQYY
jgi:hypothetical protein